jgi:hypothetical protein
VAPRNLASTRPLRIFSTKYRRPFSLPKSIRRAQTGRVTGMLNLSVVSAVIIENGNLPTKPAETTRKGASRKEETKVDCHEAGDNPEREQRRQKNNEAASKSKRGRGALSAGFSGIVADQGRGRRRRPLVRGCQRAGNPELIAIG